MNGHITHVGFSDESHWNTGRFRSLGLVTTGIDQLENLNSELHCILRNSGVKEFAWKELDGAKERFAAEKLCQFAVEKACSRVLRVDVLIWDNEDSRHKVRRRDDVANLQRMYYHLFRNVLRSRWPDDAVWELHPDEYTGMNWQTIEDYLESASQSVEFEHPLFEKFRIRLRREFRVERIEPVASGEHPLLQLADLFAGLAAFSHEKFSDYNKWLENILPQQKLPFEDGKDTPLTPSQSSKQRFLVLKMFDETCKKQKLGVSLKTKRGLRTPNPEYPLNFWFYEPQHPDDKAPTKK